MPQNDAKPPQMNQGVCPSCGRCNTCGRGRDPVGVIPPYQTWPWSGTSTTPIEPIRFSLGADGVTILPTSLSTSGLS